MQASQYLCFGAGATTSRITFWISPTGSSLAIDRSWSIGMTPPPEPRPDDLTIRKVSSRIVYSNQWMQLREDVIERPDGSQGIYTYVEKLDFAR